MRTLLTVVLRSHLINDPAPVSTKVWRLLRSAVLEDMSSDALLDWASKSLPPEDHDRVSARLGLLPQVEEALADLKQLGVQAVSEFDQEYPRRFHESLGEKRPEILFACGELSLLNQRSIGIVGSRDADEGARRFAQAVAEVAVGAGYAVVSGAAKGIDQVGMNAAYEAGGPSIGFLAESLVNRVRQSGAEVIEGGLVCLATCYAPNAPFSVGNAMGRNKLIYGHADATVVVSAANGSGGTWAGAKEAIASGQVVLVRQEPGVPEGNLELLKEPGLFGCGARPLTRPEDLLDLVDDRGVSSAGA